MIVTNFYGYFKTDGKKNKNKKFKLLECGSPASPSEKKKKDTVGVLLKLKFQKYFGDILICGKIAAFIFPLEPIQRFPSKFQEINLEHIWMNREPGIKFEESDSCCINPGQPDKGRKTEI